MGHKDLRFGQIVYILVFFNVLFYWLLPLDGFQFILFVPCLLRDSEISRLRLNIIIVCVADLLIFLFIDICRPSSETQGQLVGSIFYRHFIDPTNCPWVSEEDNSTALLPVLVRYKREIVVLMEGVRALKHDGLNIFFLVN